jgi:hypothetical protein
MGLLLIKGMGLLLNGQMILLGRYHLQADSFFKLFLQKAKRMNDTPHKMPNFN